MFKPENVQESASSGEQHGLSQRDVDQMYEEMFSMTWGQPGTFERNASATHLVLGALTEGAGYRFQETTEPLTDISMPPHAVEVLFESKDSRAPDAQMGIIFKDVTFSVDDVTGIITCKLEPYGPSPEQTLPEEAQKALDRMPRMVTFTASPEIIARMQAHKEDQLRYAEEHREGMQRFREFAATRIGQRLTSDDYRRHFDFLRYALPVDIQDGIWTIEKKGDAWRIVLSDEHAETGVTTIRDVFEFQDKD